MKPKIKAALEFLKKLEGGCPMELVSRAKSKFSLSNAEVKTLLENY